MAERSIAAVLKTVEGQPSQGSNPCLSARALHPPWRTVRRHPETVILNAVIEVTLRLI